MSFALAAALLALASPGTAAEPDARERAVFAAMQAELGRSMSRLKLDAFGPPYFLAYRLVEEESLELSASFGALLRREREDSRHLYVEARFGSPAFDNFEHRTHGWSGPASADPSVLRQQLWGLTDGAYKAAVAGFLDRKAKRATERDPDELPDLGAGEPRQDSLPQPALEWSEAALLRRLEAATAGLKRFPQVHACRANAGVRRARRYLLTSEGTRIASPARHAPVQLVLYAATRAPDGMGLDARRAWVAASPEGLPPPEALARSAEELARELGALQAAPLQGPAAAPAILDGEFTGVLFHEALGHKLEGAAQRDPASAQIFRDRAGQSILPAFLSVADDPTLAERGAEPLHGHYRYDDEGVPAERVDLVEDGVLRGFLLSRWPVKGFSRSNGHGRSDVRRHPQGRMANLIVTTSAAVPAAVLKARLLELLGEQGKPYGFRLAGSHGGENPVNRGSAQTLEVRPRLVYRVDRDGRETLVRGVKLVGTPLVVLNRVLAAGDDPVLANTFHCGAESGSVPVSQTAPSVLVSEVELQRLPEDRARPPLLPSPFEEER